MTPPITPTDIAELRDRHIARPEARFRSHMGAALKESPERDLLRRIIHAVDIQDVELGKGLIEEGRELVGGKA